LRKTIIYGNNNDVIDYIAHIIAKSDKTYEKVKIKELKKKIKLKELG